MWLKKFFIGEPYDFEKKCRMRLRVGLFMAVLGLLSMMMAVGAKSIPVLFLEPDYSRIIRIFYSGLGGGMIGGGIAQAVTYYRCLKNPKQKKKLALEESDERNRMLGLRTWAYGGYSMFLLLYIGIMISGFISITVLTVLLIVGAVYGLMLLIFRIILQKCM